MDRRNNINERKIRADMLIMKRKCEMITASYVAFQLYQIHPDIGKHTSHLKIYHKYVEIGKNITNNLSDVRYLSDIFDGTSFKELQILEHQIDEVEKILKTLCENEAE